jgi:hypothetical protein
MQTWLRAGIGDLGRTLLVPHAQRGELGCGRWTAEHDDCRNTEITPDAQEWQVSRRATFGACCGCRPASSGVQLVTSIINQTLEEAAGRVRAKRTAVV